LGRGARHTESAATPRLCRRSRARAAPRRVPRHPPRSWPNPRAAHASRSHALQNPKRRRPAPSYTSLGIGAIMAWFIAHGPDNSLQAWARPIALEELREEDAIFAAYADVGGGEGGGPAVGHV
jgi:hypothetical protein